MQKKGGGYPINQSPLFKLPTKRKLASLLKITLSDLRAFRNSDSLYSEREIPKKSGGVRLIENPRKRLKIVQASVARLLGRIAAPEYLFCPVRGRSYVTNAARHAGHRVVRMLDVRKYFPSTSRDRVYGFFINHMRCSPDVSRALTDIATYKGHLPTGSPLSPIMAFYAHYTLWENVNRIVNRGKATSSLYIDDLTVSGEKVPEKMIWDIKKEIYSSGLRYHKEKTFRDRPAEVTGVIIRDGQLMPPNRHMLKKYRAKKAILQSQNTLEKSLLLAHLKGLEGQASQIEVINKLINPNAKGSRAAKPA